MSKLHGLPCVELLVWAHQWCKRQGLHTAESRIRFVCEADNQGSVFFAWVLAHAELVDLERADASDDRALFEELKTTAKNRSPNFASDIDRFSVWASATASRLKSTPIARLV